MHVDPVYHAGSHRRPPAIRTTRTHTLRTSSAALSNPSRSSSSSSNTRLYPVRRVPQLRRAASGSHGGEPLIHPLPGKPGQWGFATAVGRWPILPSFPHIIPIGDGHLRWAVGNESCPLRDESRAIRAHSVHTVGHCVPRYPLERDVAPRCQV